MMSKPQKFHQSVILYNKLINHNVILMYTFRTKKIIRILFSNLLFVHYLY